MKLIAFPVIAGLITCAFLTDRVTGQRPEEEAGRVVARNRLQQVWEEAKTPFKYGVVIDPPKGKRVDCPSVFRYGTAWYMVYVQLEELPAQGYTTQLAKSDDLLHWKLLGTILDRGTEDTWDHANAGGGVALFNTQWGGNNELEKYEGRYWMSYLGGREFGYEKTPLWIGLASTDDPSAPKAWQKLPDPVMTTHDGDARAGKETNTLYKSFIFRDRSRTLGAPFVMFYNAKGTSEQIYLAISSDMKVWKRYGDHPAVENLPPAGWKHGVISGDPQIVRMGNLWVMFYFGAFWKPGAFNTFAASHDLMHWTKWTGEDLVKSSEPYDATYAHKTWILKERGVVYHYYCAVSGAGGGERRAIALATSGDMRNR